MNDYENDDIDGDDAGADGKEFEVGNEASVDHFEVAGFVAGEPGSIEEG